LLFPRLIISKLISLIRKLLKKIQEVEQQGKSNIANATESNNTEAESQEENIPIEDELVLLSKQLNENVPIEAYENTQITKVSASGKEITYSMKMVGKYIVTQP
jgi:hypothetical protein